MKHIASPSLAAAMREEARRRTRAKRLWAGTGILLLLWANLGWALTRPEEHFLAPTLISVTGDMGNWFAFNGIVLFLALCWTGSRNPWLERSFGLDAMLLFHRRLAMVVVAFFAGHALFRSWSISMSMGMVYDLSLLYRMRLSEWALTLGRVVYFAMLGCAVLAYVGQAMQKLSFRQWKPPHLLFYVLFPAGMVHGLLWGDDMGTHPLVDLWWTLMLLFVVDCALRFHYVRRHRPGLRWRLDAMYREADHTVTAVLTPASAAARTSDLAARWPGQFAVLRVPDLAGMNEPHPFTLSGAAVAGTMPVQCTIKEAGDFTRAFLQLAPGTQVLVEGPYGKFLHDVWQHKKLALLAGGVGVTPFMSLLRSMDAAGEHLPTVLLWSNRTRADVFAVGELVELCRRLPLTVVHCLSRETQEFVARSPAQQGTHWQAGRLDTATMARWLSGDEGCYACGPEPWLAGALRSLQHAHGIHPRHVRREHFFW